jgi:hypothetical protein
MMMTSQECVLFFGSVLCPDQVVKRVFNRDLSYKRGRELLPERTPENILSPHSVDKLNRGYNMVFITVPSVAAVRVYLGR